jgi:CubicO group peptidase (beta-lactamase class C family)
MKGADEFGDTVLARIDGIVERAVQQGPPDGQWGYGLSVLDDGVYTWEGGLGTAWSNVPSQDLTVVVLTQRAADEAGMPAVCDDVLTAARATA